MLIKRKLAAATFVLISLNLYCVITVAEDVQEFKFESVEDFKKKTESVCLKEPMFRSKIQGHNNVLDCICGDDGKWHCN